MNAGDDGLHRVALTEVIYLPERVPELWSHRVEWAEARMVGRMAEETWRVGRALCGPPRVERAWLRISFEGEHRGTREVDRADATHCEIRMVGWAVSRSSR